MMDHSNRLISSLLLTAAVAAILGLDVKAFNLPAAPSFSSSHHQRASSQLRDTKAASVMVQSTETKTTVSNDKSYLPYRGEQPVEALPEIFVPNVMPGDERLWVPQTDCVSFRPLCLCVSSGYYVNLLRVKGSGLLSRHRHPGPVHGHVLKGRWRYLEHDWEATEGIV